MAVDLKMNVLIVDDYKTMLRIVGNLLKQLGFNNIDEATDGATRSKAARKALWPRDFGLEHEPMTGLQLLKEVRSDIKLKAFRSSWSRRKARPRTSLREAGWR